MQGQIRLALIFLLLFLNSTGLRTAQAATFTLDASFPDLVEKTLPQVVNISSITVHRNMAYGMDEFLQFWGVPKESNSTSLGSGFLIDGDGYILTNHHVIAGATEVIVTLYDKRQFSAKIIGTDAKMDLALIQIRDKAKKVPANLTPAKMGDSDGVRIGSPVFSVGNPFGFQHTVTAGIISAKNRTIGAGPFDNFLQTDASINPGNSGGPLYNLQGDVIGINSAIISRTGQSSGLGFAIPVNEAKRIVEELKRYGRVVRPWLGLLCERITPPMAEYYGLPVDQGVIILNIVESGPADAAGLKRGDIITQINTKEVKDLDDVERMLALQKPGSEVRLKLHRGQKVLTPALKLKEVPAIKNLPNGIL